MPTTYEFVVETLDWYEGCGDDPDIIDTSGWSTLIGATGFALHQCEEPWRISLRRDTGNHDEGLTDRYYAYPDANGYLPDRFESAMGLQDGPRVPQRYASVRFPHDRRPRP